MKADIIWLDRVDSTNEEAKRRISDIDNLSVLSALEQTSGRGQQGNSWSSNPGENLTFSIVLKSLDLVRPAEQFLLTEIASLSVVEFLARHGINAKIKWPNDIYVGSKKICGMLIENSVRGEHISASIIGIGLNINQRNFDVKLPNPTSMALCKPETAFDIRICLEEFTEIFRTYAERHLNHQQSPDHKALREAYLSRLWLRDEPASFIDRRKSHEFQGVISGLSPVGHLKIEDTEKGELREFAFKEIEYVIQS